MAGAIGHRSGAGRERGAWLAERRRQVEFNLMKLRGDCETIRPRRSDDGSGPTCVVRALVEQGTRGGEVGRGTHVESGRPLPLPNEDLQPRPATVGLWWGRGDGRRSAGE